MFRLRAQQGHIDGVRVRGARDAFGIPASTARLTRLLAEYGRAAERITTLRARADAGEENAADQLAMLLTMQSHAAEAIAILRTRADAGDQSAARERQVQVGL